MIRSNATWRLVAVVGAAGLALAACGSDDSGSSGSSAPASSGTPLYLVDGNIGNGPLAELPPGTLTGVKGTLPGAASTDEFKAAMIKVDPQLETVGFSYGPESYDATIIAGLAAQLAKSDAGRDMAAVLQDVTSGGTKCTTFADCNDLIKAGTDFDYDGVSGPIEFDDFGDPTSAFVGVYAYDDQNQVPGLNAPGDAVSFEQGTVEQAAGTPPKLTNKVNKGADGKLLIGGYLPLTGSLASLGPPEVAGVELAVQDMNKAGGVLGKDVTFINGDSSDTTKPEVGAATIKKQLDKGVDVIIGAASSSVTLNTLDEVTGAGVLQISPANTSPDLTTFPDGGLYFRTAPSDVLQGRVLGNLLANDGINTVAILSLQDAYGEGLALNAATSFEASGGQVLTNPDAEIPAIFYDPAASSFNAEVSQIAGLDPDAVVLIGFDESAKIVEEMVKQGIGPNS
jgi:ABC-type branched-subunit amino acid transport system substrate-binding protein